MGDPSRNAGLEVVGLSLIFVSGQQLTIAVRYLATAGP